MRRAFLLSVLLFVFFVCSALAGANESAPALLASGHIDEALSALRGQINQSPNDASAHNLICRAYLTIGALDRGISACEKAVSLAPHNSRYHLWLGRIYGVKADQSSWITAAGLAKHVRLEFEAAVQPLKQATILDEDFVDAGVKLVQSLDRLQRYEEALEYAQQFLKVDPNCEPLKRLVNGLQRQVPEKITDNWQLSVHLDRYEVRLASELE